MWAWDAGPFQGQHGDVQRYQGCKPWLDGEADRYLGHADCEIKSGPGNRARKGTRSAETGEVLKIRNARDVKRVRKTGQVAFLRVTRYVEGAGVHGP